MCTATRQNFEQEVVDPYFMSTSIFHEENSTLRLLQVRCSTNERRKYEEQSVFFVHPLFNGETEWPMKTEIVCRYDGEQFDSIPIPLPIGFNDEKNIYTCYGIFCSASCVKAFMENNPVYSNALCMMWLKKIMCEVFGDFDDIVEAPPIDLLEKHGGSLNIVQFRKFGKQKTRILTHRPPFFTCALAFELIKEQMKKMVKSGDSKSHQVTQSKAQSTSETTESTPSTQSTQSTHASLKTVKKLQRQSNKKLQAVPEQQVNMQDDGAPGPPVEISETAADNTSLLPDSVLQVRANSGWDIHGLQRSQSQSASAAAFTSAGGVSHSSAGGVSLSSAAGVSHSHSHSNPSSVKTQLSSLPAQSTPTKSMFQEYYDQKSQKKETQKPGDAGDIKMQQPQKRRGRPKSTAKPESPKNPTHGTLVSFLKH